jgi:hypothetical protein
MFRVFTLMILLIMHVAYIGISHPDGAAKGPTWGHI